VRHPDARQAWKAEIRGDHFTDGSRTLVEGAVLNVDLIVQISMLEAQWILGESPLPILFLVLMAGLGETI